MSEGMPQTPRVRVRAPRDLGAGLFFMVVAAGFIAVAHTYGLGTLHRMGPGLFPIIIASVLLLLGLSLVVRSFAIEGPPVEALQLRPVALGLAAIVLFGATLSTLGLIPATAVLVAVGAIASHQSRPVETALLAAGLVMFAAVVFVWLLGLPIPLWWN